MTISSHEDVIDDEGAAAAVDEDDFEVEINPGDPLEDNEILCNIVEACLFVSGRMTSEREIAAKTGLPGELVHQACVQISNNYKCVGSAIHIRNTHDDVWIMGVDEERAFHIQEYYCKDVPFTKAEVMTLAVIAYLQPVPSKVLSFYRGSSYKGHVRKWADLGFIETVMTSREDPRLAETMIRHEKDVALAKSKEEEEQPGKHENGKRPRERKTAARTELECLITTAKFSGYFDLPRGVDLIKAELSSWSEIQELLG